MKKLYQTKIKAELLIPQNIEKDEFVKHIEGGEEGLITKTTLLVTADDQEDAIIEALKEYVLRATDGIDDYVGVIQRGELRGRYYMNVTITFDELPEPMQTKLAITLEPEDLGI